MGLISPFACSWEKLTQPQLNYSTIKKEALALLLALQPFKVYVACMYKKCTITTSGCNVVKLSRS